MVTVVIIIIRGKAKDVGDNYDIAQVFEVILSCIYPTE